MNWILEHYDTVYCMVQATCLLSNHASEAYKRDAEAVIRFIGEAHGFDEAQSAQCVALINGAMAQLSLVDEMPATRLMRSAGGALSDSDLLYDIKGDALTALHALADGKRLHVNPSWFDYGYYHTYQSAVRYAQIRLASSSGCCIAARQAGIMLALGIGCERDWQEAKHRLLQCAYWADTQAIYLLRCLAVWQNDSEEARLYGDLAQLCDKYLHNGYTVLPAHELSTCHPEACRMYALISSIFLDIICAVPCPDIDYSFVEVMLSDKLDYSAKMHFVNTYDKKEWKSVTNPDYVASTIGFALEHE